MATLLLSVAVASQRLLMFPVSKRKLLPLEEVEVGWKIIIISDFNANIDNRHNRQVCIEAWLASNLTCMLCRSTVFASESKIMKILCSSSTSYGNNSFRLEIGNINNRHEATAIDRYSITFDYFIDEEV